MGPAALPRLPTVRVLAPDRLLYRFRIYSVGGCPPVGLHQVDSANKYGDGEDDESHDRDYGPRPRAEDMV